MCLFIVGPASSSPICCYSLAWKQDRERFHTYTHWPLINKSDQGPFPHIHTTQMKTKTIHMHAHTHSHTLITEISKSTLYWITATPLVLVDQTWQPIFFVSIKATYSEVSIVFFFTLSDDCSLVTPSLNTRTLVPISCSLVFMGWIRKYYCVNLLSNLSSHHEWPHWRVHSHGCLV